MPPSPTYGDRSHTDPALPDEDEPARRSHSRKTPNAPAADGRTIAPASLKLNPGGLLRPKP